MKKLILVILILTFLSCSKDRVLDLKREKKLLVVNCTFNPDSTWELWLSSTISIGEYSEYFPAIDNATIQLFENDSLIGTMLNESNGYYIFNQKPKLGKTYSVKIQAVGYDVVYAKDSLPINKGLILEGLVEKVLTEKKAPPPWVGEIYKILPLKLKLKDSKIENNFYKINAYITPIDPNQFPLYVIEENLKPLTLRSINSENKKVNSISWEQTYLLFDETTFTDSIETIDAFYKDFGREFNGNGDVTKIEPLFCDASKLNPFGNGLGFVTNGLKPKEGTGEWKLEYSAELQTISESYYKYNKTHLLQQYNRTIPGSEFNNIYSNVVGGKGIFGGYQSHKIILQ
jgi:hypothetical protein